jgi:hypothetical protein
MSDTFSETSGASTEDSYYDGKAYENLTFPEISDIQKRNNHYFRLGDRVRIASQKSAHELNFLSRHTVGNLKGKRGYVVHIQSPGNVLMPFATFEDTFILYVRMDDQYRDIRPKVIKIEHHDVINLTVLGVRVSKKLYTNTCDSKLPLERVAESEIHWPTKFEANAVDMVASREDYDELMQWRNEINNHCLRINELIELKLNMLNRKLRWTILYGRIMHLPSYPEYSDF